MKFHDADITFTLFATDRCQNECVVCCDKSSPKFSYAHIGETAVQRKGLEHLMQAISMYDLRITGGDPLRNPILLSSVIAHHYGNKHINFNPMSFLTIELKKSGSKITIDDANSLIKRTRFAGFSRDLDIIVQLLAGFNTYSMSCGDLQAPNRDIMLYANLFFDLCILPRITEIKGYKPEIHEVKIDGSFENGKLIRADARLNCVGNFRFLLQKGIFDIHTATLAMARRGKVRKCGDDNKCELYFSKENGENVLYMPICCVAGASPYTSIKTDLTLKHMADMDPGKVKTKLMQARDNVHDSTLYFMLSGASHITIHESRFAEVVAAAQDLVKEQRGRDVNIVQSTYTLRADGACKSCEACNNMGRTLYRAGISPRQFHSYLDKRFGGRR